MAIEKSFVVFGSSMHLSANLFELISSEQLDKPKVSASATLARPKQKSVSENI
jgi:hypothetical protein